MRHAVLPAALLVLAAAVSSAVSCGGSASETPWPAEPESMQIAPRWGGHHAGGDHGGAPRRRQAQAVIPARYRQWLAPALACAAMLVLPALSWLLIPRPAVFVLPPAPRAVPVAVAAEASGPSSAPHPVVARPPTPPRAASTATAEVSLVAGVVLDPDGHPAKGAIVTCDDREPPLATMADDEGHFTIAVEAVGCAAVARHAEFFPSERLTLAGGNGNSLRLARGGGIEGEVVDERGAPVVVFTLGVESYTGSATDQRPAGGARSFQDPRGGFLWESLPAGRYVLTASGDGRPPTRSRPLDVEAGRVTAHVRITLAHGATLTGRVLDASTRKPINGATVALDAMTVTRAQTVRPARSDEQGAYALEGAPEGPFSVRVTHEGYRTRTVTGLTTRGGSTLTQDIELNPLVDGGPTGEDFAGIGAFLEASPKGVAFGRLMPDGPAEKAGLLAGDLIRRIDGADASAFPVVECMQNLRGPDGSRVSVQVERAGRRIDVTIQRRALTL